MTEKVNGFYNGGEFLTGDLDFVSVYTTIAMGVTGVVSPLKEFKDLRFWPQGTDISAAHPDNGRLLSDAERTIDGVVYANDAAYVAAFWSQENFNKLLEQTSKFASPVILTRPTVTPARALAGDPLNGFDGNAIVSFAGTGAIYGFLMAVEHASAFAGVAGTKTVGAVDQVQQLNDALAAMELRDATGGVVTQNVSSTGDLFAVISNAVLVGGAI